MNYATSLELPSWTAEAQRYGIQTIRYTPVIFKAFHKSFTPQIIATAKDLSHYYFECGRGAGKWTMNLSGITHNPLQAAVRSAVSEITSADAQATYRRIGHIVREAGMDALVVGLCGVVAIAQCVEVAQKVYRTTKRFYRWVDARLNPAQPEPSILPSVDLYFAQFSGEDIAAHIDEIRNERSFLARVDRLDAEALAIVQAKADGAIAQAVQATADQLKGDRAALVLQKESDRHSREALAYVVDRAVAYATAETVQVAVAPVIVQDSSATALDVTGATGTLKRQRKISTGKAAEAKPMQTKARAKTGAK
jgi:hypothetical protein